MKTLPQPEREPGKRFGVTPREMWRDPLQIGLTIVGVTAVFGGIGWWIDSLIGSFPFLMAIGAAFGLFGILYATYLRVREADRLDHENRQNDRLPPSGE